MTVRIARIYLRVGSQEQDLQRQELIIDDARTAGYCIAGVYREKASGARADRPELLRLIADLQPGEVVIAEKIDRISRLPLPEVEKLVATIRGKGRTACRARHCRSKRDRGRRTRRSKDCAWSLIWRCRHRFICARF
ncbi:recombinase family protein [Pararhizobium sp. LjRoot255]|uniref:recombinase family protein n=1 Tax=Pararhizobium sp. LjRoot255 TaxID=3342298 RepID=UPI003F5063D1